MGGEGGGGEWRGWSCWGSNKTLFSSLLMGEYGSMWAHLGRGGERSVWGVRV